MTTAVPTKKTTKVWYFKAGENSVKLIDYHPDDIHALLECDYLDCQTIYTSKGIFTIYFNDNGLYEDNVINKPASQVLGKLPINWGRQLLTGNYIVKCTTEETDDDGEYIAIDMPSMGFKEWITICSDVLHESHKRRVERMKAEGYKEVFNKGGFSVSVASMKA
jgi:hypothetical protein